MRISFFFSSIVYCSWLYKVTPLLFPSIRLYEMRPKQQKNGAIAANQITQKQHHLFKLDLKTNKRTIQASLFRQNVEKFNLTKNHTHTKNNKKRNSKQNRFSLQIKAVLEMWSFFSYFSLFVCKTEVWKV